MAALNLKEDQSSGQLTLEPRIGPRLTSVLGNLAWLAILGVFFIVPSIANGRFDVGSLVTFLIIFLFSVGPSISGVLTPSIKIDCTNRVLSRTTSIFFIPIRSYTISFGNLANIEVQYYRASNRRVSREAYRANAIDRAGNRVALNWDGKRDEIFDQAQKIAAMTGAPLIDNTAQSINVAGQVIEQVRKLGLPLPQEMTRALESSDSGAEAESPEQTEQVEPTLSVPEPSPVTAPARGDSHSLAIGELEQRVANDPTDSDARYALASKYHARGQLDRAIEMYQATLQTDTSNAEAQSDLGVALQQRGKRTEAEAAYRRSIALDPFSFRAHLNLALLLRMMNRATEASQEFFQARQNARGNNETRLAESASTGARLDPQLSKS